MFFVDLHTHSLSCPIDTLAVYNHDLYSGTDLPGVVCSVGYHPWNSAESDDLQMMYNHLLTICAQHNVWAVGECGLDKLRGASLGFQLSVLEVHIKVAEQLKKPLIIHCVKAFNELIGIRAQLKPKVSWIVHGFMGNKQMAGQLLRAGIFLSIGPGFFKHHSNVLNSIDLNRLFVETDSSDEDIQSVYNKASGVLNISDCGLKYIVTNNFKTCFGVDLKKHINDEGQNF